jgi:hypothetical protein
VRAPASLRRSLIFEQSRRLASLRAARPPVEDSVQNFWKEAFWFEGMFTSRQFWDMLMENTAVFFKEPLETLFHQRFYKAEDGGGPGTPPEPEKIGFQIRNHLALSS